MDPARLTLALQVAEKSNHPTFRHVALIFRGSKLLVASANFGCNHAETRALAKVPFNKRSKLILYSLRFNRKGDLRFAKPCPVCYDVIQRSGAVKIIYYSDNNGNFTPINL